MPPPNQHRPNHSRPPFAVPGTLGVALTRKGAEIVELDDVFDLYLLRRFWQELVVYLVTGDGSGVREFAGVRVGGRELLSDPGAVDDWFHGRGKFAL